MESSIIVSSRAILPFKGFLLDTKNKSKEDHLLQLQKQLMQLHKESPKNNSGLPGFKHWILSATLVQHHTNQTNCKLVIKLGASPRKIMLLFDLFLISFSFYYCFPISQTLQAGSMKQVLSAYNLFTTIYLVHSRRFSITVNVRKIHL